jgi:hypothetical protein
MTNLEINETGQQFMIQLFEQTQGDQTVQVSMYNIGRLLGLEREAASRVAEELIALQMVEIRTLSGGIGISAAGSDMVRDMIGPPAGNPGTLAKLGNEPLLEANRRQALEQLVTEIKDQTGTLGLDFDTLSEIMADLKSIDAQLDSPRPKTAIFRECFVSIAGVLKTSPNNGLYKKIRGLLGE